MREVGHAGRDINDRYTYVLIEAHLAAAEQTAALIRGGREDGAMTACVLKSWDGNDHGFVLRPDGSWTF